MGENHPLQAADKVDADACLIRVWHFSVTRHRRLEHAE
jgi:hypothetical protein